jgi:hypothetical protein
MPVQTYKTNLNCGRCVATVAPHLNGDARIRSWSVDTQSPDKVLRIEGDDIAADAVRSLVDAAGFQVLAELNPPAPAAPIAPPTPAGEPQTSYVPIVLLFALLVLGVGLLEVAAGAFDGPRAMARFMGGFFFAFAYFKLLDIRRFADAFAGYDLIAARSRAYALAYPFIELLLGAAYLSGFQPMATNAITLAVMTISTLGVLRSLVAGRKVRCACLGAVFQLPMSYVTLAEDVLMAAMAAAMLASGGHH